MKKFIPIALIFMGISTSGFSQDTAKADIVSPAIEKVATTINVTVSNNVFTPFSFTAKVGDVVLWTWIGSTQHNVTSTSVPTGAATFASPTQTTGTFSYTITVAGTYLYACLIHGPSGMGGIFSSSTSGINDPKLDTTFIISPNPFVNKVTIRYRNADEVRFTNMVGETVKSIKIEKGKAEIQIDLAELPSGVYFCNAMKEGVFAETRKIVKR